MNNFTCTFVFLYTLLPYSHINICTNNMEMRIGILKKKTTENNRT